MVLSKRKPVARKGKIVLLNASRRVRKGRPKNYIPEEDIRPWRWPSRKASRWRARSPSSRWSRPEQADYNLSPSRWVGQADSVAQRPIAEIIAEMQRLDDEAREVDARLADMLARLQ